MRRDGSILCVLGADTGVGKTIVTSLLLRHVRSKGGLAIALKPFSSGDRADARALLGDGSNGADLDCINPWHYEAPLAPLIAARISGKTVPALGEVVAWIETHRERDKVVIVEGAGGVMTPIAETYTFLDVSKTLAAGLVVVVRNRLGAINQARMCYETGKRHRAGHGVVVLSGDREADCSTKTNRQAIAQFCPGWDVLELPFVGETSPREGFATIAKKYEKPLAQILQAGRNVPVLCETNRTVKGK